MGYDRKYGNIVSEFGDIPPDEPVIVFRGRDRHIVTLMNAYYNMCRSGGDPLSASPEHHLEIIKETIADFQQWQMENRDKIITPRSDRYIQRMRGVNEAEDGNNG